MSGAGVKQSDEMTPGPCVHKPGLIHLLVCCLVMVNGCSSQPSRPLNARSAPNVSQAMPPASVGSEVQRMLREAEMAFLDHRLTTPVGDNAWERYQKVLSLDPGNESATRGISDLVEKYLEWALEDIETGNIRKAGDNIARARAIDNTHPNLPAVEVRLAEKLKDSEELIRLQISDLDRRSPALEQRLMVLGAHIQSINAMVVIVARSDAEGRWIYQQMNKADPDNRIRAQIRIEGQPYLRIASSP